MVDVVQAGEHLEAGVAPGDAGGGGDGPASGGRRGFGVDDRYLGAGGLGLVLAARLGAASSTLATSSAPAASVCRFFGRLPGLLAEQVGVGLPVDPGEEAEIGEAQAVAAQFAVRRQASRSTRMHRSSPGFSSEPTRSSPSSASEQVEHGPAQHVGSPAAASSFSSPRGSPSPSSRPQREGSAPSARRRAGIAAARRRAGLAAGVAGPAGLALAPVVSS